MKNRIISAALTLMFTASLAAAQTGEWHNFEKLPGDKTPSDRTKTVESSRADREPANPPATADRIAAARAAYMQPEGSSANALAQFPGRRLGAPVSRGARYPGPAYAPMFGGRPSGRHVLIGAIIGGLLGAAVGSKGSASAGSTLAISALGAGLGAGIGLSIPSVPGPQMYPRRCQDDREEAYRSSSELRSDASQSPNPKQPPNQQEVQQTSDGTSISQTQKPPSPGFASKK